MTQLSHPEEYEQLYQELENCPVLELTGIVSSRGSNGVASGNEDWSIEFQFFAWHNGKTTVQSEPIMVRKPVTYEELEELMDAIKQESIVKIKARVSLDNFTNSPQALLEELLEVGLTDKELEDRLKEYKNAATYEDDQFGKFVCQRSLGSYNAKVSWKGVPIELNVAAEEGEEEQVESTLKVAKALWENEASWDERIHEYAIEQLLPKKNGWLLEGENEVSAEEFKARMRLSSIKVFNEEEFTFWFNDGDLFWGHMIQIDGTLSEGPTSSHTPG